MFKIITRQIEWLFSNPKFYIAILLGSLGCIFDAVKLVKYSEYLMQPLSIFDAFIYSSSDKFSMTMCFLGVIFLLSDIPFCGEFEVYTLLRISKRKWIFGKLGYVVLSCILYYSIIILIGMIIIAPNAFAANVWSDPLYTMAITNEKNADNLFNLYFSYPNLLFSLKPVSSLLVSISFTILYSCCMGIVLLILNMKIKKSLGLAIVVLIHAVNYVILLRFFQYFGLSLFGNSLLGEHNFNNKFDIPNHTTILQSYLIFLGITLLLVILSVNSVKKYEFSNLARTKK